MRPPDDLRGELAERVDLHRRRFLGLLAAGSGALVLGGCSTGSAGEEELDGATVAEDGPTTTTTIAEVPPADAILTDPFRLGVASGDPLPTSVILWTRLAPDPVDPAGSGGLGESDFEVLWEMAADEEFTRIVASGIEPAAAAFGHSVHADVDGLDPDSWYWYRFRVGNHTSPVGRSRTMPADGQTPEQLVLAVASCQLRWRGHWTAYDHLVRDAPDLVFHLGDYVYEYPGGEGDLAVPLATQPVTMAEFRVLYGAYKRDEKLQAAHAVAPWIVTWDDHEVQNNYAADVPEYERDADDFGLRRRSAYQAFWEHHPVRLDPPADDGSLEIHRSVRFGDLAEFFVLDGRQYRTDQVCGDEIPTFASECDDLGDEDHTMLGEAQERWLDEGLAASEATWKVLAQQTVVKALVLGDVVFNVDQWDGYPAARSRLLGAIRDGGIDNVVVLTGDIHAGGAADIREPNAGQDGQIVAHELVAPGISSAGISELGALVPLDALGVAYGNFVDNGYVRCTVTPERWTAEFVVVETIARRTSDASVDATVDITAGTPGIVRR